MAIPRIIHQLWKDEALPDRYRAMRETWRAHQPDWELRLWTDRDLKDLVETHYPSLLEVYNGYAASICRADLGRYLVLRRFGGVYADLDCECLKPIGPLLEGARFIIAEEPAGNLRDAVVFEAGFRRLICPSFIACEPGHPAWDSILAAAVEARHAVGPLEATGPFLLTRTFDRCVAPGTVRVMPAAQIYPVDKHDCWSGRVHDLEFRERATRDAFVLHYWDGGWFRDHISSGGLPGEINATVNRPAAAGLGFDHSGPQPKISSLMVSGGALEPAKMAIDAFLAQTYANKQLVIVAAAPEPRLLDHLRALDRADIRLALMTAPVEAMWDHARSLADGPLVCCWEEGDLHDPRRLEIQYAVLKQTRADACLMRRWTLWRRSPPRLGVVADRPLVASLLCLKAVMPDAAELARDGGAPAVARLLADARVALFDLSRLLVRVDADDGADALLATAFEGDRLDVTLAELGKRLPVEARARLRQGRAPGADIAVRLIGHLSSTTGVGAAARGDAAALAAAEVPFVCIDIVWPDAHAQPVPVSPLRATPDERRWPVNLVHMNPGDLGAATASGLPSLTPSRLGGAYTIGAWAWETETGVPAAWRGHYAAYDEIWAPSRYAADAIARSAPMTVSVMPHVVEPTAPTLDRAALGLPADTCLFLFAFHACSNVRRKNPDGVIAAYRAAFPTPSPRTMLLVKAIELSAANLARLTALADGRADIRIVNEAWSADRLASAIAACDAYVSLHRAEGFGLTMAEAMYFGRPVIATAYSGNMDYMSAETALLVPYQLSTLDEADGDYDAGSVWAEPDLDAAAALMAQVAADPSAAAVVGARAAAQIRERLSAEAVGARMLRRLERARRDRAAGAGDGRRRRSALDPRVLILTPVKDARPQLPRYAELVRRLDHDPARLSLAFMEGDSRDGTYDALAAAAPELLHRVDDVALHRWDYGFQIDGPRWAPEVQRRRREIIARSRNRLLAAALRPDHDWVLWLDADLVDYPADLLRRLLAADKQVVVPHCLAPDGRTFDLNTFKFGPDSGGRDDPAYLRDGIFQPPRGVGRLYLDAFQDQDLVEVDAVGGTALLVRADLHRDGLNFPTFSYRGYIETEGLAMMARDMGARCWGLPNLRIVHG